MTIEILDLAEEDIYRGYVFYEKKNAGWEIIFSTLFSEKLNLSTCTPEYTKRILGNTACSRTCSLLAFFTQSTKMPCKFKRCSTYVATLPHWPSV